MEHQFSGAGEPLIGGGTGTNKRARRRIPVGVTGVFWWLNNTLETGSPDGKIIQATNSREVKPDEVLVKITHSGVFLEGESGWRYFCRVKKDRRVSFNIHCMSNPYSCLSGVGISHVSSRSLNYTLQNNRRQSHELDPTGLALAYDLRSRLLRC